MYVNFCCTIKFNFTVCMIFGLGPWRRRLGGSVVFFNDRCRAIGRFVEIGLLACFNRSSCSFLKIGLNQSRLTLPERWPITALETGLIRCKPVRTGLLLPYMVKSSGNMTITASSASSTLHSALRGQTIIICNKKQLYWTVSFFSYYNRAMLSFSIRSVSPQVRLDTT